MIFFEISCFENYMFSLIIIIFYFNSVSFFFNSLNMTSVNSLNIVIINALKSLSAKCNLLIHSELIFIDNLVP